MQDVTSELGIIVLMESEIVRKVIADECGLPEGITLVVGVSGGPDSICMMDILARLNFHLVICHFDHGLRPESADEARYVEKLVKEMGKDFLLGKADVHTICREENLSIEEGARVSRYRFLFRAARQVSASAVVVAHTADDQVETVLMHLLRGSGLAGLRGMKYRTVLPEWDEVIPLVRPMLGMWRTEILEYCALHRLKPVEDSTNQDVVYFRNRLRHVLIPSLETHNPQIKPVLWRMSNILAAEDEYLEKAAVAGLKDCSQQEGTGWISLSSYAFESLDTGLQRRILRLSIGQLRPGLRDVDFDAIERGRLLVLSTKVAGQVELTSGLRLYKTRRSFFIAACEDHLPTEDVPQLHQTDPLTLTIPGRVELANGWLIECEVIGNTIHCRNAILPDSFQAWMDADCVQSPFEIRRLKPGDRFLPLGMEGHSIKLADLFINAGIPRFQRKKWPLIISKQMVCWVPGVHTSELVKLSNSTRSILHLTCIRFG